MKKMMVLLIITLAAFMLSGCGPVKKHCFIRPSLNDEYTVTAGSRLVEKIECYGRVTVNECSSGLWLIFLGKTGGNVRIQSSVGTAIGVATGKAVTPTSDGPIVTWVSSALKTPIITEILYPESSKFIEFQDLKIEIIEATDSRITFKLINISTQGCNKVNGEEVK
jgi:uncharacterized protein YceK